MSFFCAGSSASVKKRVKQGSKPSAQPIHKSSSNGRVATNPFQDKKTPNPTIPFSDQPSTKRMVVLQEYKATDHQGLSVTRGEQVQVLDQQGDWYYVRNENKKEGFVPANHLVAPYSATRTGRKSSNPLRPVASGSTVNEHNANRVPMYPSHSAGVPRPQDELMNRANYFTRQEGSSQIFAANDTCNNNNPTTPNSVTAVTMYEQKYSPSSSSGVASMNGPSSPSFQSLQEHYHDNMGTRSSGSSLTQERNSLSSVEENSIMETHHYHMTNGSGYPNEEPGAQSQNEGGYRNEDVGVGMRAQRTNSESSLMHMQTRPLPHPPPQRNQEGVYFEQRTNHIYSTITNGEGPPPLPPRERPPIMMQSSLSQPYPDSDEYIAPADAVQELPGPHLDRPRVKSLSDVRAKEGHRQVHSNMDYSEVFHGKVRVHRRNGYHHGNDTASEHSEGGSSNHSSRRGSTSRRAHDLIAGSREFVPQEPRQLAHVPTQSASTRISKFRKCLWGVYVVTETFASQDENELSVNKGEHVSVWNQDDQDWFWIVKHSTSEEGFVPSRFLKEASEAPPTNAAALQSQQLPPVPPKQHSSRTHQDAQFRSRTLSQDSRSTHQSARNRSRLNSDGSSRSRSSLKGNHSMASVEKMEIPESPSNSPPPPYCEYEQSHQAQPSHHHHVPTRHYSHSSHHEHTSHHSGAQMQRTRSQGHVTRQRPHPTPPMQRFMSPPETYNLRSPTNTNDGTLV